MPTKKTNLTPEERKKMNYDYTAAARVAKLKQKRDDVAIHVSNGKYTSWNSLGTAAANGEISITVTTNHHR